MVAMSRQQEYVLRTLEERDIRFVRLWFTDIQGYLKSVAVAPAELEGAFAEGIGFDGSSIEGFSRVVESDTIAKPDPSTFQILPLDTAGGDNQVLTARMFCDIAMPDGEPSWADPRQVLRRQLSNAADEGFSCYVHPEIEFFLLKNGNGPDGRPVPADTGVTSTRRSPMLPRCSVRTRSRPWSLWVSRWSSRTTRQVRGSRKST